MAKDQQEIRRKLRILDHAAASGDVSKTCRYFGIGRASFYRWRHAMADHGEAGLADKRSVPHNHPNRTPEAVTEKVLHLRRDYQLGPNTHRLVFGALSWAQNLGRRRVSHLQAQWCEPPARRHAGAQNPHQAL